jgi:hypothetical protein
METDHSPFRRNPAVGHERSDVSLFGVAATVIGTLVGTLLIVGLLWFFFQFLRSQHHSIANAFGIPERFRTMTKEPVLQRSPTDDLEVFKREQLRRLRSSSWTDRERGLVSIPIDRAVRTVLEKSLPSAETLPGLQLGIPSTGHRQTGFDRMVTLPEESR